MAGVRVNPAELEGEELEAWYRRTPGEIEAERRLRADHEYDEFFGEGRWQEARAPRPVAPRPAAARPDVLGGAQRPGEPVEPGDPDSFLGTYAPIPNPQFGPAYLTRLPPPLNRVEPSRLRPGEFVLSDGSTVTAAELERIHAEQTRRMAGEDAETVAPRVRRVDRVAVGTIPDAATMGLDEREDDPSCHPHGGWEREQPDPKRSQRSRDYEAQISRAPGLNYVVRGPGGTVAFDGCAVWDPQRQLLEAKGPGYAGLAAFMADNRNYPEFNAEPTLQAGRQAEAADGRPIDWHVAERGALPFFKPRVEIQPNLTVRHTPPMAKWRLVRRHDQPAF